MNLDGAFSDHLIHQVADGLLDENGRFQLDRGLLKKHYAALASDERESVSSFMKSARRWDGARPRLELNGSHLRLEIRYPKNSPIPQRLGEDPTYRLSAIFPSDHYLYDLAVGYNGLAFSESTRGLKLTVQNDTVVVDWYFQSDTILELLAGFEA